MHGDFSRDSYDARKHYQRVLMQQGRPLTDADWNEQRSLIADSQWNLVRSLLRKRHGTFDGGFFPRVDDEHNVRKFSFCSGSYWVEGLQCFLSCDAELEIEDKLSSTKCIVLLEAWEQLISPTADREILEPALSSNDTAWRTHVAWRLVRCDIPVEDQEATPSLAKLSQKVCKNLGPNPPEPEPESLCRKGIPALCSRTLLLRRRPSFQLNGDPACESTTQTGAVPRRERLYRVEVHHSGKPWLIGDDDLKKKQPEKTMTFKWSRENASRVYAIHDAKVEVLTVDSHRFSSKFPLLNGTKLELRDQWGRSIEKDKKLVAVVEPLIGGAFKVAPAFSVEPVESNPDGTKNICANEGFGGPADGNPRSYHVQCWDHSGSPLDRSKPEQWNAVTQPRHQFKQTKDITLDTDGCVIGLASTIAPGRQDRGQDKSVGAWLELEDGIQIQFQPNTYYVEGDYWLIRVTSDGQNGFANLLHACKPITTTTDSTPVYTLSRSGGRFHAPLAVLERDTTKANWELSSELCWHGTVLPPGNACNSESTSQDGTTEQVPAAPAALVVPKSAPTGVSPPEGTPPEPEASILSPSGQQALRKVLASPLDLARHLPARWLNYTPRSASYRKFRAALLLLDILKPTFEDYFNEYERCARPSEDERIVAREDAARDYELATGCRKMLAEGGVRSLFG